MNPTPTPLHERPITSKLPSKGGINVLYIKATFKRRNKCFVLARLEMCEAVWHLWQERNRRIFQQQMLE